jgi:hypothetical protein
MLWIGIYPRTFLRPMEASTAHLLEQMQVPKTMLAQPCAGLPVVDCAAPNVQLATRGGATP